MKTYTNTASLLTLFINLQVALGFATIFIAHVMFIVSYVVVTVKARLIGFDRHLEEAAMDLGANEWTTFRKITLPLLAPAILSAALLGFALSIDDFVITYFNAGSTTTFPLLVWGAARVAVPPQINVVASAIFLVAVGVMVFNIVIDNRRSRRGRRSPEGRAGDARCRKGLIRPASRAHAAVAGAGGRQAKVTIRFT